MNEDSSQVGAMSPGPEREQPQSSMGQASGGFQMSKGRKDYSGGPVNVNPVNYPSLTQSGMKGQMPSNIELLLDVQMILTVELGRTKKYVKYSRVRRRFHY